MDSNIYPAVCQECGRVLAEGGKFFSLPDRSSDDLVCLCSPDCAGLWFWDNFSVEDSLYSLDDEDGGDGRLLARDDWWPDDSGGGGDRNCDWCGVPLFLSEGGLPFNFGSLGRRRFCDDDCAVCWLDGNTSIEDIRERGYEIVLDYAEDDGKSWPCLGFDGSLVCDNCGASLSQEEGFLRDAKGCYCDSACFLAGS